MNKQNKLSSLEFYNYIIKILSLSKIGSLNSESSFDSENFKKIQDLSLEMLENFEHVKFTRHEYFRTEAEVTPKVKVYVAVFSKHDEILLLRNPLTKKFSLIGDSCSLYETPLENAKNIFYKQTKLKIKNEKLIGVFSSLPLDDEKEEISTSSLEIPEYIILVKAELDSKFEASTNLKYFSLSNLPKLDNDIPKKLLLNMLDSASKDIITIE